MFRSSGNFDKLLDKATSNLRLDPDWPAILQICDLIRQSDCPAKYAIASIKKKLYSPNPHQAMFAMLVLESVVKNCGSVIHDEITTKANCEMFREIVTTSQHENVRTKMLELIQAWAFAFRQNPKYRAVQDTMNILKTEGRTFPALKESDAMFSAHSAPEWADGEVCNRCRVAFSLVQRKHHCRACGQVVCSQCSGKTSTLPKFGIEKEVRVCDACYDQVSRPVPTSRSPSLQNDTELPVEYLTSSLAQQNQTPARRTAQELQEEEELQLALALSQSEAEVKRNSAMPRQPREFSPHKDLNRESTSPVDEVPTDPELVRYLNRGYWEQRQEGIQEAPPSPSAPAPAPSPMPAISSANSMLQKTPAIGKNIMAQDKELDEFTAALRSQIEIFVNRMKSNSSRGRSIANDSSVQTLFLNLTAMHSKLLRYIQQQDDAHVHFEGLQDKLTQVKDSRAALDVLREEHREKVRKIAEEAERQRQMQMAHKLDIMRKKKQEYLQYQRQLALQKIQEQEREMQMRQEQQKQQYIMGPQYGYNQNSPVHAQYPVPNAQYNYAPHYQPMMHMPGQGLPIGMPGQHMMGQPGGMHAPPIGMPPMGQNQQQMGPNQQQMGPNQQQIGPNQTQMVTNQPQMGPNQQQMGPNQQQMGPNQQQIGPSQQQLGLNQQGVAPGQPQMGPNSIANQPGSNVGPNPQQIGANPQQMGPNQQPIGPNQMIRNPQMGHMNQPVGTMNGNQAAAPMMQNQNLPMGQTPQHVPQGMLNNQPGVNLPGQMPNLGYNPQVQPPPIQSSAPPGSPQTSTDTQTAELISFD